MNAKILFASNNEHKLKECKEILPQIPFVSPNELHINCTPKETGTSFFENALCKAHGFYAAIQKLDIPIAAVLSEDSGICVHTLNNAPGIYSARYGFDNKDTQGKHIANSFSKEDTHFQCKLLQSEVKEKSNTKAHFTCCTVLLKNPLEFISTQSIWEGKISQDNISGDNGFGYDPIFICPEHNCPSSHLLPQQKNKISHRAKALRSLYPNLCDILNL